MRCYIIKISCIINVLKENKQSSCEKKKKKVINYIISKIELVSSADILHALTEQLDKKFFNNFQVRWKKLPKNKRNFEEFEKANRSWMDADFTFVNDINEGNYYFL